MAATHESGPDKDKQDRAEPGSAREAVDAATAAPRQIQEPVQRQEQGSASQGAAGLAPPASDAALQVLQAGMGNAWVARRVKALREDKGGDAGVAGAAAPAAGEGGSGAPLGPDVQAKFEGALGADLSGVRVHTGGSAESAATQMNARAFTVGQDIYGPGSELSAGSAGSRETLAHEVIHTVQNQAGRVPEGKAQQLGVGVTSPGDSLETEAERGAPVVASGGSFTVAGSGVPDVAARATADVTTALDAADFSVAEVYRQITACETPAGERATCYANAATMNKMHAKLSASQMLRALQLLDQPGAGGARLEQWIGHCRQAGGATRETYDAILTGAAVADLDHLMGRPATMTVLQAASGTDPITIFPHLRGGLNAAAAGSRSLLGWLVATATPDQVFRVISGASGGDQTTIATNLNASASGWNWVDGLDGASLTAGDRAVLAHLHTTADAAGKAQIDARTAVAGPAAPVQGFAQRLVDLQTGGAATAAQARACLQTATAAERLAVLANPGQVAWLNGLLTGNPLQEWGVATADLPQFMAADAFFLMVLDRLPYGVALRALTGATAAVAGPRMDANVAQATAWLSGLPARNAMSGTEWNALVAIYQAFTNAGLKAIINTHYGDTLFMAVLTNGASTFAQIKTGLQGRAAVSG